MSAATEAAMGRRANVKISWRIPEVTNVIAMAMRDRVRVATMHLLNRVTQNISRPVTKTPTMRIATRTVGGVTREKGSQYTKVTDRSVAGEFPKADTTLLLTSLMTDVQETMPGCWDGFVGTPLDYGLMLELRMERQFLTRTLREEAPILASILGGPITVT